MDETRPYLTSADIRPRNAEVIIEWVQYLAQLYGMAGAMGALRFYARVGWISEPAVSDLIAYLRGLSVNELHNKKYDEPETVRGPLSSLSGGAFSSHARSLNYIAAIAGDDIEQSLLLVSGTDFRR